MSKANKINTQLLCKTSYSLCHFKSAIVKPSQEQENTPKYKDIFIYYLYCDFKRLNLIIY